LAQDSNIVELVKFLGKNQRLHIKIGVVAPITIWVVKRNVSRPN
jgi:hypothetical protein